MQCDGQIEPCLMIIGRGIDCGLQFSDGTSVLRLTRQHDLRVDGLKQRDDAMIARGQKPMGDLSNALQFSV